MSTQPWASQSGFDVRFEWGASGIPAVCPGSTVVIVDVLRFTTTLEAATSSGVTVYPYRWRDNTALDFAQRVRAVLAGGATTDGPSLSPRSLLGLQPGDAIVLPSPNGSTCSTIAHDVGTSVVGACLRNYRAIGAYLRDIGGPVSVIACGERWPDGSLRPALEDYLGAAAVLSELTGRFSPEAQAVAASWSHTRRNIGSLLHECTSGQELLARGCHDDLHYASQLDVSATVPLLREGAFRRVQ